MDISAKRCNAIRNNYYTESGVVVLRLCRILFVCLLCVGFLAPATQADNAEYVIQKSQEAYYQGNYAEQFRLLGTILQTSPKAEWFMGDMHERGLGRPKNKLLAFQHYVHSWARGFSPDGSFQCNSAKSVYITMSPQEKKAAQQFMGEIKQRYGKWILIK